MKAVIEQMAVVGYKELNESGEFVVPGFVKNVGREQARHRSAQWDQSFHEGTHGIRGQAGQQVGKGITVKGRKGFRVTNPVQPSVAATAGTSAGSGWKRCRAYSAVPRIAARRETSSGAGVINGPSLEPQA